MTKIDVDEIKSLQLDIMKQVHNFCKIHGIKYFLAYGTLIGAIRHRGYIPWDDDIDIMMLRPDYEKFVAMFNGSCKNLIVVAPENDLNYYAPYANVIDTRTILEEYNINHLGRDVGVKIDVFPLDAVSKSPIKQKLDKFCCRFLNAVLLNKKTTYKKEKTKGFARTLLYVLESFFFWLIPYKFAQWSILKVSQSNEWENAVSVDNIATGIYENPKSIDWFSETIEWPFEDCAFNVPQGYDEYLKNRYGDYMKLPPEDEQVPHHGFVAYWK